MDSAKRGQQWLDRHHDMRTGERADEVEFRALKEGFSSLSEGLRDEKWTGVTADENDFSVGERWHEESEVSDSQNAELYEELKRRRDQLGVSWPFHLDGMTLRHLRKSPSLIYELCLCITRARSITQKPYNRLPVDFEEVSLDLLLHWLGGSAQGLRTGWPRSSGLPKRCKELFTHLHQKTGDRYEWRWDPDPDLEEDPDPEYLKEGKLDLLAWLKMPTSHGHVYFAGQCACGSNADMEDKARELTHSGITKWVKPPSWVPFVRCFFVPHVLVEARLRDIIREGNGNATFDRARLALLAQTLPTQKAESFRKKLQSAVDLVLSD
jgi:hypothetical protein